MISSYVLPVAKMAQKRAKKGPFLGPPGGPPGAGGPRGKADLDFCPKNPGPQALEKTRKSPKFAAGF